MRISCTDQSTGLLNRRGFDEGAASALSMADKANLTTTALMCDLDRFKSRRAALVRAGNRGPGGAPRWRGIRRVDGRVPHEPAAPAPARPHKTSQQNLVPTITPLTARDKIIPMHRSLGATALLKDRLNRRSRARAIPMSVTSRKMTTGYGAARPAKAAQPLR
jgi:hypothetical protein